jgi:hypothetical protein
MRIQEIQRTKSDTDTIDLSNQKIDNQTISKIKMLPGSKRFGYTAGPGSTLFTGANFIINLFDVRHPTNGVRYVGYLALREAKWFPIQNSFQVANVALDNEYRGQGLGQNLYGIAMKLLGMTIVADDTQTPEARRSWIRLSQIPGVTINGYASVWGADWDNKNNLDDLYDIESINLIKALLRGGGQEIGGGANFTYVSFPVGVNANQTELQSIKKGLRIYSAKHPEDDWYSSGLYARWTGK